MGTPEEAGLTERRREILRLVVEEYVATGQPVGSKHLVQSTGMRVSPSTVRAELAELEALGLLTHPHTSAGGGPPDRGATALFDWVLGGGGGAAPGSLWVWLLGGAEPRPRPLPVDLSGGRSEVEDALRATTEALAQVTRL